MPTPRGLKLANEKLSEIVRAELKIRDLAGQLAEEMALIQALTAGAKERYRLAVAPHERTISTHLPWIVRWYRNNLWRYGTPGTREIVLDAAKVKAQMSSSWKLVVTGDPNTVLEALAKIDPQAVSRVPNLAVIEASPQRFRKVPGVELQLTDTVRITSPLLEGTAAPKQSRLSCILRTFVNPRRKPVGRRAPSRP